MASFPRSTDERSGSQGYLPRGGACVSCRRRKMRCDGVHPVCSQCDRAGRQEDCEYTTGQERSTVQILEENINRLEARIQELQNPDVSEPVSADVRLHQPYTDPPRNISEALINGFFPHATQLGLYMCLPRLYRSFFLDHPIGHPARPAPALISSIYLWGIHLARDPSIRAHENAYVTRATQDVSTALSGNHPDKVMHAIQATVLLATYFFTCGRFFQAKFYINNAVTMVFSAGLHKIRSPSQSQSGNGTISPPRDSVEEGERIMALWTVLDLDNQWAVCLDHTPSFEYSSHPMATKVDTPWPLEMEDFEQGRLPQNVRTSNTVQNFLNNVVTPDAGISLRAIEAKAAVLWERVAVFNRKCSANSSPQINLIQEFRNLSTLLDSVVSILPSSDPQALGRMQFSEKARRVGVTLSMLCSAGIRLYAPFITDNQHSRDKRVMMAKRILEIVIVLRGRGSAYLNPLMGHMWIEATQVLFDEISRVRSLRASGNLSPNDTSEHLHLDLVQQATTAMVDFTTNMPLTKFQVDKIQQSFLAI